MLATGTHVLIRVKSDIRLSRIGEFLPDGSYLATISGGGATLTVRVIEYHVTLAGTTTAELFCLVTDLHDHVEHPAHLLAEAYRWRWDGSETALGEAKSTLHGAAGGSGAILRSHSPALVRAEHAAWMVATELVHALTRAAAQVAAPFTKGPRTGRPVAARDLSFTTTRHTAVATITATTAALPAPVRAAVRRDALQAIAVVRGTTDRHRHRDRKIKTRQPFPQATADIATSTIPAVIHVCGTTPAPTATITGLRPAAPTDTAAPPDTITEYAA